MKLDTKKITRRARTLSANIALLIVFSFIASSAVSKFRTGDWFFSIRDRKNKLSAENCKEFSCAGFADFNDIRKAKTSPTNEPAYCIVSNPIFGYYNICTKGKLGLSKETNKIKPKDVYRVLLLGGSQANINTLALEDELNKAIKRHHSDSYETAEVFGAAIGGGKQPMQLQTANALLAMGYQFDSIININGWNEIMLTTWENKRAGIPPIYPRSHVDRLVLEQRVLSAESSIINCTSFDSVLSWHPGYNMLSYLCIKGQRESLAKNQNYGLIRAKLKLDDTSTAQHEVNTNSMQVWRVSSQSLDALSSKHNLDYVEVIQPTKSTDPSKAECFQDNFASLYKLPAKTLLPNIENTLLDLREMSVIDGIFSDCVHLNDRGSRLLAQKAIEKLKINQR